MLNRSPADGAALAPRVPALTAQPRRFGRRGRGGRAFYPRAMPTPVDNRANLHTASVYGQPLGVRCKACIRRGLVPGASAATRQVAPATASTVCRRTRP